MAIRFVKYLSIVAIVFFLIVKLTEIDTSYGNPYSISVVSDSYITNDTIAVKFYFKETKGKKAGLKLCKDKKLYIEISNPIDKRLKSDIILPCPKTIAQNNGFLYLSKKNNFKNSFHVKLKKNEILQEIRCKLCQQSIVMPECFLISLNVFTSIFASDKNKFEQKICL